MKKSIRYIGPLSRVVIKAESAEVKCPRGRTVQVDEKLAARALRSENFDEGKGPLEGARDKKREIVVKRDAEEDMKRKKKLAAAQAAAALKREEADAGIEPEEAAAGKKGA